jgi:proline iminopeptidase
LKAAAIICVSLVVVACGRHATPQMGAPVDIAERVDAAPQPVPVPQMTQRELTVASSGGVKIFALVYAFGGEANAADTVIVLPGGPALTHEYLEPFARLATPSRRVVLIDARGSGRSTAPKDPHAYTLDDYANDLDAVIAALGVERVHVIGHSWGGLPALAYAIARPERVISLTLLGGGAPSKAVDDLTGKRLMPRVAELQREGIVPKPLPGWTGVDCAHAFIALMPAIFFDPKNPAARSLPGEWRCAGLRSWLRAIGPYDLTKQLSRVTAPVLVMSGEADPSSPDDIAPSLAPIVPEKIVLTGCGHFPWLERPDDFFGALDAYMVKNGSRVRILATPVSH